MASFAGHIVTPITLDRDTFPRQRIARPGHLNKGIPGNDVAGTRVLNAGLSLAAINVEEYQRHRNVNRPFALDEPTRVIVDRDSPVVPRQRIAPGDDGCDVTVHPQPTPDVRAAADWDYLPEIAPGQPGRCGTVPPDGACAAIPLSGPRGQRSARWAYR